VNLCCKPSCARPGAVVLGYDYASRTAVLTDPTPGEQNPHLYVICGRCAEKLSPPKGWTIEDLRSAPPLFTTAAARPDISLVAEPEPEPVPSVSGRQLFFGSSV
jgi:hypothetical protein